ncbi:hypothetical protein [Humibacter albus]|uniref:hypothetical protein n=1 Tax=Humibacter albus TaxID=427754 RepID=UPI0003B79FFF|nr:hypothetical protein [Humibacter albus]
MASISIAVVSDTKAAVHSVQALSTEYSSLVDQLNQLGPDGQQASTKLEEAMKSAQLATQDAASASKGLVDEINRAKLAAAQGGLNLALDETADSGTRAAAGIKKVSDQGGKLAEGLKMNASFGAGMLATELGSNQNGLAGSADAAATALAGMGMMMGPEVALPAAALGGLIAWLAAQLEKADTDEKAVTASANALVKAWVQANPAADAFGKTIQAWAEDSSEYGITLTELARDTNLLGMDFGEVAATIAGTSVPALEKLKKATDDQIKTDDQKYTSARKARADNALSQMWQQITGTAQLTEKQKANAEQAKKSADAGTELSKVFEKRIKAAKEAAAEEKADAETLGLTVAQYKKYAKAMAEAQTDQTNWNSTVKQSFSDAATAGDDYVKSQAVNWDTERQNMQEVLDAYNKFPDTIKTLTAEGLSAAGKEFAESNFTPEQLESFLTLPDAQKQKMIDQWNQAGKDAKKGLKDGISAGDIGTVTVPVKADTSAAKSEIKDAAKSRTAKVTASASTKTAKSHLDDLTKTRHVKVIADLDDAQFKRDLNALTSGYHSLTVTVNERVGKKVAGG